MQELPALNWIVNYLEKYEIPYLVCGGLAAQAYGSSRALADIDIYVPHHYITQISNMGNEYITFGPAHHVGEKWDLTYVQFEFGSQKVEIGSDKECKIFDSCSGEWHQKSINFERYIVISLYGKPIRVMAKDDLIAYKKKLSREVDLEDIRQISHFV